MFLNVKYTNNEEHKTVLAFARTLPKETIIFILNLGSTETNFELNIKKLLAKDDSYEEVKNNVNAMCYVQNLFNDEEGSIKFIGEFTHTYVNRTFYPYATEAFVFNKVKFVRHYYEQMISKSNNRLVEQITMFKDITYIDQYQIIIQLKYILEKTLDVSEFANWIKQTYPLLLQNNITLQDFISKIRFLNELRMSDYYLSIRERFFDYCDKLSESSILLSKDKEESEKIKDILRKLRLMFFDKMSFNAEIK